MSRPIDLRREKLAFLAKAADCSQDECLIWPFARSSNGYGAVWIDGKDRLAHRIVCEIVHGAAPAKHEAAHSCGNGRLGCVNGCHLSWKTRKENHADKLLHGTDQRGERHNQAKLTDAQVLKIRSLKGKIIYRVIAKRFGVTHATIESIMSRRHWKHI